MSAVAVSHVTETATAAPPRPRNARGRSGPVAIVLQVLLFVMYGIPILWILLTSIKSSDEVIGTQASIIFTPTLDAYVRAFEGQDLWPALAQSLIISASTTVLVLAVAIPCAYALARVGGRWVTVALALLIVLQMMPQTATVIPLFQVFGTWGLLDSTSGLVLADAALLTPFAIVLLRPFFRAVPIALEESASIDGAGIVRRFFSIVLPVARNGVATTATLVFLICWGEFLYAINFLLSPGTYPLSALLAQQVSAFGIDWPALMALSVITSIPILILFAATYRLLREGLTVGAVK
jgi:multiple sugar transport system permease protein